MSEQAVVYPKGLDAWLAEHAMGVPMPPESDRPIPASSRLTHKSGVWFWSWEGGRYPDKGRWIPIPYSTSATASDALLEAMKAKGWSYSISFCSADSGLYVGKPHFCQFKKFKPMIQGCEFAETKNLAIALAAKTALEVER
jgi:hypothetical protein